MIIISAKASDENNTNDLIRSLVNNAEIPSGFNIFITPTHKVQEVEKLNKVVAVYSQADLLSQPPDYSTLVYEMAWLLTDEVFILGSQWDKRLNYYKDKYEDGIFVMFPSGYKPYGGKSETEIAMMAEKYPVMSKKWIELVGTEDTEMICRMLFLKHNIDRRIDIRLIDVTERGISSSRPPYDPKEVEKKADVIAEYIKNFTQSVT